MHRTSVKGGGKRFGRERETGIGGDGMEIRARGERIKEGKEKEEERNGRVREEGQGFGKGGEGRLYQPLRTKK